MSATARERLGTVGVWMNFPAAVPLADMLAAARAVEELGYGALWYAETPRTREALVQAALLLGATERIGIATGITSVYSRDAIALHAGAAALEEASPGRFVLGMGVSHAPAVEARGHDYTKPLATMRGYLDALDDRGGDGAPPRVLAALRNRMLELARDRAAGAHPYFVPVEHTARARAILGEGPLLAPEVTVVVEPEAGAARARARAFMERYLQLPNYRNNLLALGYAEDDLAPDAPSDRAVDDIVAWGDADAVAARVRAHREAGADHVCIQALADDPAGAVEQLRALAPLLLYSVARSVSDRSQRQDHVHPLQDRRGSAAVPGPTIPR
jgi:probable F420-dependent oxidoreductase